MSSCFGKVKKTNWHVEERPLFFLNPRLLVRIGVASTDALVKLLLLSTISLNRAIKEGIVKGPVPAVDRICRRGQRARGSEGVTPLTRTP